LRIIESLEPPAPDRELRVLGVEVDEDGVSGAGLYLVPPASLSYIKDVGLTASSGYRPERRLEELDEALLELFARKLPPDLIVPLARWSADAGAYVALVKLVVDPLALVEAAASSEEADGVVADLVNAVLDDIVSLEPAPAPEALALASVNAATLGAENTAVELAAALDYLEALLEAEHRLEEEIIETVIETGAGADNDY